MHPSAKSSYILSTLHMRQHWHTLCYKVMRRDGGIRRFTSADTITDFRGELFYPEPGDHRDAEASAGMSAGDTEFRGVCGSGPRQITAADIDSGKYADALVIEYRIDRRRAKLLTETHFYVEDIDHNGVLWTAALLTLARQLRQNFGPSHHNLCDAVLGDARCGALVTEQTITVTAVSSTDPQLEFTCTGLTATANIYALGRVLWLTGNNAGTQQRVYSNTAAGVVQLGVAPRRNVVVGDTGKLRKGCDGTAVVCKNVHSNLPNHRGNQFSRSSKDLILARGTVN